MRCTTLLRAGLLFAVLGALWALPAEAQTGEIAGRVVDAVDSLTTYLFADGGHQFAVLCPYLGYA